jgi:hypothetical protein
MLVRVVDLLEVIDVQEDHAVDVVALARLKVGVQFAQLPLKLATIDGPRQGVVIRGIPQLAIQGGVALGMVQVPHDIGDSMQLAIRVQERDRVDFELGPSPVEPRDLQCAAGRP